MTRSNLIRLLVCVVVPLIVLMIPESAIPIRDLAVTQHRVLALFLFAMLCWVLEPIPIFATSVLVLVIELLFISNGGLSWFRTAHTTADQPFGELLKYRDVMATMADPIIMLFLGGFFLGAAATKYQLDTNLGRVLLKPFGTKSANVMLGMMVVTAIFSMFMSNTATTAMMLAVLMPVLRAIKPDDPARIGFALAIPFAANVGGIGTPIGTPPNAVGLKYLVDEAGHPLITFPGWMAFAVPFVIALLLATWLLLLMFFRPKQPRLEVSFEGKWQQSPQAWIVYITSAATIVLWLTGQWHGMSSTVVAMIPVGVFSAAGILTSKDIRQLSWDVLWLVAGGFGLGLGLEETGLSEGLINSIPFDQLPALVIVIVAVLLTFVMANFMSHTATSNLILPIMATLGTALPSLVPLGGRMMLILVVTFAASLSMSLPISTPPNAMSYATGWIETRDMAKAGVLTGVLGLLLVGVLAAILNAVGFFNI